MLSGLGIKRFFLRQLFSEYWDLMIINSASIEGFTSVRLSLANTLEAAVFEINIEQTE